MARRIIIIGAGPTGLGAAYRLHERGYKNWQIYEKNDYVGGLAASFVDDKQFTWDVGGHVLFSHYSYFDDLFETLTKKKYYKHVRQSWIWIENTFVPYPFQNNIGYLPKNTLIECLTGLVQAQTRSKGKTGKPKNFEEWIHSIFGTGISKHFMIPYNKKVWGYPLRKMDMNWIAERVSVIDYRRLLDNVIYEKDDISWGPNDTFKFPKFGGTGSIFRAMVPLIRDHLTLEHEFVGIDRNNKKVVFKNGRVDEYDMLINTSPLDKFIPAISPLPHSVLNASKELKSNRCLIVGIGLKKQCPDNKCWIYFPQDDSPFYRVTYFSNYSPHNAPDRNHYSLMCETTYSRYKKVDTKQIVELTITGLINSKFISEKDRKKIVSTFVIDVPHSYPIPTVGRDGALRVIQKHLEQYDILSRGRFGGWKYEIGNMDHSVMQGVEAVDRILHNKKETIQVT